MTSLGCEMSERIKYLYGVVDNGKILIKKMSVKTWMESCKSMFGKIPSPDSFLMKKQVNGSTVIFARFDSDMRKAVKTLTFGEKS